MRRRGKLFEEIVSFGNLLAAARRAVRGKRYRPEPLRFHYHLETNLLRLQEELTAGTYRPAPYRAFRIREPKPRLISAALYRDRVVHHAVMRVVEPVFDRTFIFDSYANRAGKGSHRALERSARFARGWRLALKCDVEKYFPSVDHHVLMDLLARKLKCPRTLSLLRVIIAASNPQEPVLHYYPGDDLLTPLERRHGIPIGNLTSQFFGNVMLDPLDHWIKETLRRGAYLRYMDDFLVFGNDKRELHAILEKIREFLYLYRLTLHARKCVVMRTGDGVPFLGWQVFPTHRRIRRATGLRFQRQLKEWRQSYARGEIGLEDMHASLASWSDHLRHGDTLGLRRRLLGQTVLRRGSAARKE